MPFTQTDFLSGQHDDYFKLVNQYSDSVDEYTPYRGSILSESQLNYIAQTNSQMPYATSCWQSNVGANGLSVVINIAENISPETKARKLKIQTDTLTTVFTKYSWNDITLQIIKFIVKHGNAVLTVNKNGELIVNTIFDYNLYHDKVNKTTRYAYRLKGKEVKGMDNLRHGVDIWHFKDPVSNEYPSSPSRIDAAFAYLLLENKAIKLNTAQFANGYFSNVLFQVDENTQRQLGDTTKDDEGKTRLSRWMDAIKDKMSGTANAAKTSYIPGVTGVIDISKSNQEAQFQEMLKELTPERIAWAYSLTLSNFGAGSNLTENNALTFDDALYDKVGRNLERALETCLNNFVLKTLEGLKISGTFKVTYNPPEDRNRLLEIDSYRLDLEKDAITVNEYRGMRNLQPLEGGDVTYTKFINNLSTSAQPVIEPVTFFSEGVKDYSKKETLVEKALKTPQKKAFQDKLDKAFTKQLNAYVDLLETSQNPNAVMPKLETYFAFNIMQRELLKLADVGIEHFKTLNPKKEFSKEVHVELPPFATGYPTYITDLITNRTTMLLKGLGNYRGLDSETSNLVNGILANYAENGVAYSALMLRESIPELSKKRSELIAQTEIGNAVMASQEVLYKNNNATSKKFIRVFDGRTRPAHIDANNLGWVAFDFDYGGFTRGGDEPNCRCDTIYGFDNEHLNK